MQQCRRGLYSKATMVPWKMAQVENHPLTIRQEPDLTEPQQPYFLGHCETMPIL